MVEGIAPRIQNNKKGALLLPPSSFLPVGVSRQEEGGNAPELNRGGGGGGGGEGVWPGDGWMEKRRKTGGNVRTWKPRLLKFMATEPENQTLYLVRL